MRALASLMACRREAFDWEASVLLKTLFQALPYSFPPDLAELDIAGITDDSRRVRPGWIFVAIPGVNRDGHAYLPQAAQAGAALLIGEREPEALTLPAGTPYLQVRDSREALAWLHAAWCNFPARQMTLIGVTGTDGKTTTTNLIYQILKAAGLRAGMISTVNAQIGDESYDTGLHTTTPPAPDVQAYLAQMVAAQTSHAVLEATSHGLAQHRLTGCDFDVAVVTNITHEHLDYHGTWEAYRDAKALLFRNLGTSVRKPGVPKVAVLNADDEGSYAFLRAIPVEQRYAYGVKDRSADVIAERIEHTPQGLRFVAHSPWGTLQLSSRLIGAYNVSNILAAATATLALGIAPQAVETGVAALTGVPGRMELIDAGQPFIAIVDFAHTPNALQRALETAREIVPPGGRVIVTFGSAGLRDRAKRRLMGAVAARLADLTVITAEDPRTESLDAIMAETADEITRAGKVEGRDFWRVADRGEAIRKAVELARPGDIILACGKGHEQSMCFGEIEYPWDDREAMRRALHGATLDTLPTAGKA